MICFGQKVFLFNSADNFQGISMLTILCIDCPGYDVKFVCCVSDTTLKSSGVVWGMKVELQL